jgi:hypothetical protein
MAKSKGKAKGRGGGGLSVAIGGGLNKKNYAKKGSGGDRLVLKQGDTATVQFVAGCDDSDHWKEISQHQFQDKGRWNYVPCLGDDCPLCEDDDRDVSKVTYRFFTNVYSMKDKKIVILEGPKDLSGRIARKWEGAEKKKPGLFLKRTYDVSKLATTPVSYDVEIGEDNTKKIDMKGCIDLDAYIRSEAARYYGDEMPGVSDKKSGKKKKRTALDDDEDEAEEDTYEREELMEMDWTDLKRLAKSLKIKLVDKEGEKRKRTALVKLILKAQD